MFSAHLLVTNTKDRRPRPVRVEIDRLGSYMLGRRISDYEITMFDESISKHKNIVLESIFCNIINEQIKREYEDFIS